MDTKVCYSKEDDIITLLKNKIENKHNMIGPKRIYYGFELWCIPLKECIVRIPTFDDIDFGDEYEYEYEEESTDEYDEYDNFDDFDYEEEDW